MPPTTASATLKWDVLVTKRQGLTRDLPPGKEQWTWVPTSATLIFGERDAVLVDAFLTAEQAAALVEWVATSGKNLTTIYVTHGHGDHFFGIGALLNRFPNARAMATPDVVKIRYCGCRLSRKYVSNFWNARYPGQIPERLAIAEELKGNVIQLEGGRDLVVVEVSFVQTLTTRHVCTSLQPVWWSQGMPLTTTFTFTSRSQTRKLAASGSLRLTPSNH